MRKALVLFIWETLKIMLHRFADVAAIHFCSRVRIIHVGGLRKCTLNFNECNSRCCDGLRGTENAEFQLVCKPLETTSRINLQYMSCFLLCLRHAIWRQNFSFLIEINPSQFESSIYRGRRNLLPFPTFRSSILFLIPPRTILRIISNGQVCSQFVNGDVKGTFDTT